MTARHHPTVTKTSLPTTTASVTDVRTGMHAADLKQAVIDHLRYSVGRLPAVASPHDYYRALALAVRDRMQQRWMSTTQTYFDLNRKIACYLSAEFLMGPHLGNNLVNLGIEAGGAHGAGRTRPGPRRRAGLRGGAGPGQRRPGPARRLLSRFAGDAATSRPSATASATSSASSTRRSTTAGRSRSPTSGCATATPGRSPSPTSPTTSTGAATPSITRTKRAATACAGCRTGW